LASLLALKNGVSETDLMNLVQTERFADGTWELSLSSVRVFSFRRIELR